MNIITKMKVRRMRMGLTQAHLGFLVGVGQPRISAWENGSVAIPDSRRDELAFHLQMQPDELDDEA